LGNIKNPTCYARNRTYNKLDRKKKNMEPISVKKYQSVLPSEAIVTKNFKDFCRMIGERLIDIKHKVKYLSEKAEYERHILRTRSTELTERDKKIIRDYINKLELEIEKWTKVRTRLHKLVVSETKMRKVFANRNSI
jgi:hypothetical protein